MIKTTIVPDTEDISIHLPHSYVGKKIEVLLYAIEELYDIPADNKPTNNALLRGQISLTEEEYNDFQQHVKNSREEWGNNI